MTIIQKIDDEIATLLLKKKSIQELCSHPAKTSVRGGSDGDIMSAREPSYWITHTCELCGKVWSEDQ
jgi:hypothetical protein